MDAVDWWVGVNQVNLIDWLLGCLAGVPAWETDRPASSISWSKDHPPISMRSLSRDAAFWGEIAYTLSMLVNCSKC